MDANAPKPRPAGFGAGLIGLMWALAHRKANYSWGLWKVLQLDVSDCFGFIPQDLRDRLRKAALRPRMLEDIANSTKTALIERFSSPLIGSFALAWCAWNYRFIVVLLSDASISQTFELIDKTIFPDLSAVLGKGLLFPMITACLYVFIYPYPARFIYEFTLKRQREINDVRRRINDETPLSLEESRRLKADFINFERKNQQTITGLNEEITRLRAALDGVEDKTADPPVHAAKEGVDEELPLSQLALLQELEAYGGKAFEGQFLNSNRNERTRVQFDIGELKLKELITRVYLASKSDHQISFTHEGRKALLDAKNTA
jgi:hypothetical protein